MNALLQIALLWLLWDHPDPFAVSWFNVYSRTNIAVGYWQQYTATLDLRCFVQPTDAQRYFTVTAQYSDGEYPAIQTAPMRSTFSKLLTPRLQE
jgi:hypothetical protein